MLKNISKSISLVIFVLVYLLSFLFAYFFYLEAKQTAFQLWWAFFVFDVVATLLIWLFGLVMKNASIYDPYWSVFPPILFLLAIVDHSITLNLYSGIFFASLLLWAIRLTWNFVVHFDGFQYIDWRYQMLEKKHPKWWFVTNLFGINLMPTLIVFIQLIVPLNLLWNSVQSNACFVIGVVVMISATLVEGLADAQMRNYKSREGKKLSIIHEGLWRYSRHPNYFGEVSFWWGVYFVGISFSSSWIVPAIAPVLMSLLFVFISIPMMEKKILKTRPEYKEIQQRVSVLIPLPNKKDH